MIKFKNVAGDSFLAVGTIQRKFALNGEKSLSGVLYDGDDVLNNIDKGWSLEFDGEPYVVSYFERNDSDNTLSFDAVHKFFWVMSKSVLYSETSGSHTIKWYLDQIFANTGYSYALNFNPNAIAKDNWGMKTKLSLFNDIISSINGEFEINGTLISIFEKVGSDLSTIVRYGFNLSDMSIENDAAGFVTYGEGFGAYEDQQNQSGPRLHATYTSPLASVYGILQAEPVDDQRYTSESSIVGAIKAKVDGSFSVSIKLSLYDLTAAGYPYKTAHVGDWLMAIDEKLDFKQRIRIISIDDEFDANGNRISYTVTAGNIGVVQKYQEANASLSSQVSNALDTASKASDDANIALISANGKNTSYYVDSVDALPAKANEGDMGWVQSGDGRVLYIYKKKPDGTFYWEKRIDPEMGEQIAAGVNKALTDAKTYSDQLVATNREQVNAVLDDVQAKQADLTAQQAELDTKAKGYANQALADAKADTQATAQQIAQDAQTALNNAETTLQQEISQKVSQADYDAKTGDLSLKVLTAQQTADQANTTIGNYKQSNDGRVSAAESKIDQNANAISQKVSQSDYNTKTGQLDAQISTINQTATGISQSVSNVQAQVNNLSVGGRNLLIGTKGYTLTNPGQWNNSGTVITDTYQGLVINQTGDAWGGPKYLISDLIRREVVNTTDTYIMSSWFRNTSATPIIIGFYYGNAAVTISPIDDVVATLPAYSDWVRVTSPLIRFTSLDVTTDAFRFEPKTNTTGGYIQQAGLKLEKGNMPTDWAPAPEDTDNKISTVSQKVDSITSIVSDPATGLTKRVQTAEGTLSQVTGADIPALQKATYWQPYSSLDLNTYTKQGSFFFNSTEVKPNAPTTKTNWMYLVVEQGTSDSGRVVQTAWYDTQTDAKITYRRQYAGTWSPWYANDNDSVATIAQTNGAIQTEISNRQTGDTNTLTQAKDFTTSSISNSESGMMSQITQASDAILANLGSTNLFPNSEFEKDYGYRQKDGNTSLSLSQKNDVDGHLNGTVTVISNAAGWQGYWARNIPVYGGQSYSASVLVHYTNGGLSSGYATLDVWFVDKDGNRINTGTIGTGGSSNVTTGQVSSPYWVKLYIENVIAPTNAVYMQVSLLVNDAGAGQTATFTQPMVTATEKLQPYAVNNDITTQLALFKDNWSIGIADNAGAITNGIVGNSTNMSLISNNVVINAPSTQIKGTAWINSAMIGNGAIGTAQIGDAAITSAKIANLDVSKITGNVTNFIQSNWNGVYESTTITNDGMQIVTSDVTTYFGTYGIKLNQGGESVGGIGVSSYVGMPDNFQGIAFNLDGTGDYMTWGARASGVTTGDYATKLAWFRSSYKPSGQNAGFNFSDDSPVTFWGDIYGRENTEPLKIAAFGMKGVSAGGLGHGNGSSAITFGGDGETYIISSGTYYHLTQLVKALQPLIGLGTWSAPKNINSNGVVTQWTNVTT